MTDLGAFMRRLDIRLFLLLALFALFMLGLVYALFLLNWPSIFTQYEESVLQVNAYQVIDDMREQGVTQGPFNREDREWLDRRAEMHGIAIIYQPPAGDVIWYQSHQESQMENAVDVPLVTEGETKGILKVAYPLHSSLVTQVNATFTEAVVLSVRLGILTVAIMMILVAAILARRLSAYMRHASKTANDIRLGDREIQIEAKGSQELRKLITAINELAQDLHSQEGWRQQMMQDLAHEVRTPLTSTISEIEAMIDGVYPVSDERLSEIYEELERLTRMVSDVEELSEAEGAKFKLNIERENMVALVRGIHRNFQIMAREKRITFSFDNPHVPCYAEVDRDRIIQIVSNLISNAIKYTPIDGEVIVGLQCYPKHTVIYCQDNGIGIAEEDLEPIFSRFYRADKSRSRSSGGLGLGLSIVKALVEAHDGKVNVRSRPGEGSTFWVTIPNEYKAFEQKQSDMTSY